MGFSVLYYILRYYLVYGLYCRCFYAVETYKWRYGTQVTHATCVLLCMKPRRNIYWVPNKFHMRLPSFQLAQSDRVLPSYTLHCSRRDDHPPEQKKQTNILQRRTKERNNSQTYGSFHINGCLISN
jgi:hypothetical protein